jgi:bifunctional non-homologous end joining protein LigD
VVLGVDGISDFGALRSRQHDGEVQLYAFDILALDEYSAVGMRYST